MTQNLNAGRLLVGLVVVFIGVWLLLANIGVTEWGTPWRWFPMILVIIGLWALVRSGFRDVVGPALLILIGVAIQLTVLPYDIPQGVRNAIWPAVLIVIGLVIIMRGPLGRRTVTAATGTGDLNALAVFWGSEQRVVGAFDGGSITCVFGGVNLDLREAQVTQPPAAIDVTCLFGGCEIRAPDTWLIQNDALALFGGVSDQRRASREPTTTPQLTVRGTVLFGGVTIKD